MFLSVVGALSLAVVGDTGGTASASILIVGPPGPRLMITPDRAVNAVGEPHVLTILLEVDEGHGWTSMPGETIDIRIISGVGWLSPGPYVTDANGKIEVILNSDQPGLIVVEAEWNGIIDGDAFTVSDTAQKEYIDVGARLTLEPDGTNRVGDPHVFTAHLEFYADPTIGWVDGVGESLDIVIVSGPGWLSPGPYVTDANGEVTVVHESDVAGVTVVEASWDGLVAGQAATASDTAEKVWETDAPVGAGGAVADCVDCAPPIPALYATKRFDVVSDQDGDGLADPGDTVRYSMLIVNFATFSVHGVEYIEPVDPHVRLVQDSFESDGGWLAGRDLNGVEVVSGLLGSLSPGEEVRLTYDVVIEEELPSGVAGIVSQGTLFAETTFPIVTDDPMTEPIHDATWTPIERETSTTVAASAGSGGSFGGALDPAKSADVSPDSGVLRVIESGGDVRYSVQYENTGSGELRDVRILDVVGPRFTVDLDESDEIEVWAVGGCEIVIASVGDIGPGETVEWGYRAVAGGDLPFETAYTATRAMLTSASRESRLTDDPLTDLGDDATCVLFPYRCSPDEERTWEDWVDVVSQAPTGLLPLVIQEKDASQHLRWILFGGDFFGDLSLNPSTRPSNWTQWALVGLVEVGVDTALARDPGFRLAQREEPYVEAFLAEEPFFMWVDKEMPLYGRVPATDAGPLLRCDGFAGEFCDYAYFPLLVELDWSRDWDMRWLEDDLIVATIVEESDAR